VEGKERRGDRSVGRSYALNALVPRVKHAHARARVKTQTQTSLTGHLHGMVLSFLMDLGGARQASRISRLR
jgi:hypothetical protein